MNDESLWGRYVAAFPDFAAETPAVEQFGDSPEMADELLELVLAGTKRATAGLFETDIETASVGCHWVVTDSADVARVVLRTTEVRVGPLSSVDESFAFDEGEGDRTIGSWLNGHRNYFRRNLPGDLNSAELDALHIVFERFEVVWPPDFS